MLTSLLLAVTVSAGFEGGALKDHRWVAPDHLVATIPGQSDNAGRNHQPSWFYFRVTGVKGRPLTIDLAGLEGEYNFKPHDGSGHRTMHPAYSYDNVNWRHFSESEWLEKPSRIRVKLTPERDTVWIARIPPYTLTRLARLLQSLQPNPALTVAEIGQSVERRPIQLLTITDASADAKSKKTVWLMARQHAWEAGTSWVLEGALRYLLSPEAADLRRKFVYKIVPVSDPDGVAHGGVRFNRNGFDLNRNWDLDDATKMPEIAAVKRAMAAWAGQGGSVDFFVTLHNTESTDYVSGPHSAGGARIREVAQRLNARLESSTHFHSPGGLRDQTKENPDTGRMTVDRWVFTRYGAPAFLIELMVDPNPKLGRAPETSDRLRFGAELVKAVAEAIRPATD